MKGQNKLNEAILTALRRALYAHPSQRAGQVIANAIAAKDCRDTFYIEDERLVDALRQYAAMGPGK